jgi:hypothetical protein
MRTAIQNVVFAVFVGGAIGWALGSASPLPTALKSDDQMAVPEDFRSALSSTSRSAGYTFDPIGRARLIMNVNLGAREAKLLRVVARVWFAAEGVVIIETHRRAGTHADLRKNLDPVFATITKERPLEALEHVPCA